MMTKSALLGMAALLVLGCFGTDATAMPGQSSAAGTVAGKEPDYSVWNDLLKKYYDPARGMDYRNLKARDAARLKSLRQDLGRVDVNALDRKAQLAYYINLYNVNVVGVVVDHYPVKSIRDISTDPIRRLNVFEKDFVPFGSRKVSLNDVENKFIRERFKDPRIHFAINCAALDCPPIRPEAYVGARVDAQLDDQTSKFLNGPKGLELSRKGSTLNVETTKVMDWFEDDFKVSGGNLAFIKKYASKDKLAEIQKAKSVKVTYDDYDWSLNVWKR